MNLRLDLEPLSIYLSRVTGYGLKILGYGYNDTHRGIGFKIYSDRTPTGKEWLIVVFLYAFIRRYPLKSVPDSYQLVCNHCGNTIWKSNKFCPTCQEYMEDDEFTRTQN